MKGRILGVAVAVLLLGWLMGIRPWGAWYSRDFSHRLQTEALLRGTFALAETPHGQRADWAWGNGSQQVWGLGVPLLRLPLEAAAKLLGGVGFPDRLTFLLWFGAVAWLLARAFARERQWESVSLVAVTLFCPAFITMCRTRFAVYEEAVAYAALGALLLAACLLRLVQEPTPRRLFALCLLSGAAVILRPTSLFYGVVTAALALWSARRLGRRTLAIGVLLCAVGPLLHAWVNQRRFGDPLEVGQRLNVSRWTLDQYAKNFDYAYHHEPLASAAAELGGALFRVDRFNGNQFYDGPPSHPGQSPTVRFREHYFSTFDLVTLAVLLGAWIVCALRARAEVRILALWSAASFALLAAFYLRMPSMTSRYAVDFAPAVAMGLAALLLLLYRSVRPAAASLALAVLATGWVAIDLARADIDPGHAQGPLLSADTVRVTLPHPATPGAAPPASYRCGDDPMATGISFNGIGWAPRSDCSVDAHVTLYLPATRCIELEVAALTGVLDTRSVRAKLGLVHLERTREQSTGQGALLTFCRPPSAPHDRHGIEIAYLGFVEPSALRYGARVMRLLLVRSVP